MTDPMDLDRLAEIPDPFADSDRAPGRRMKREDMARSLTRPRVRALRAIAAGGALAFDGAWVVFVKQRPDLHSVPAVQLALGLAVPLACAALALNAATRRGEIGLGEAPPRVATWVIAALALFVVGTAAFAPPLVSDGRFWHHAIACMLVTTLLAAGPLALGFLAFRRAFATASTWRGAALGAASGALAAATISLACPVSSAAHVVVGHGTILLVAGILGAALAQRFCRT